MAAVEESGLAAVVVAEGATTIKGTHASHANRAGSFLVFWSSRTRRYAGRAPQVIKTQEEL